MKKIGNLAVQIARRILEPTPTESTNIDADNWDWQWNLIGNESSQELESLASMLTSAKRFVSDMANGAAPRWLTLIGLSGAGKTHLAQRIRDFVKLRGREIYNRIDRKRIDQRGESVNSLYSYAQGGNLMIKWTKLIQEMRDGEYDRYKAAQSDWFKIVDDFGLDSFDHTGKATMLARGKMADLCDRRLRKWTIFTTNFSRKELGEEFDFRIPSRMIRNENIIVDASCVRDFNLRKEKT